jgi:hypothetical protein
MSHKQFPPGSECSMQINLSNRLVYIRFYGTNIHRLQAAFHLFIRPRKREGADQKNILATWIGGGLFPFKPAKVLVRIPKPSAELTILEAITKVGSSSQYEALPTPTTPRTGEALTSLLNMIKQIPDNKANS